jgi:hypothetical protein
LLFQSQDEAFREVFARTFDASDERCAAEREKLGLDHALLGGSVLSTWNLPAPVPEVIVRHHGWARAKQRGGDVAKLVAVVRLADLLAVRTCARPEPNEEDLEALRAEPGVPFLGLACEDLVRMWPQLRAVEHAGRSLVGPATKSAAPPRSVTDTAAAPAPPEHASIAPVVHVRSLKRAWLALTGLALCIVSIAVAVPLVRHTPAKPGRATQASEPAAHPARLRP